MVEQLEQTKSSQGSGSGVGGTALKAAAAAAAAGAAAVVARKAFSHDSGGSAGGGRESNGNSGDGGSSPVSALGSIAAGGWEAARDALVPAAEDAAGAAGAFVAENAPEIVRDRIVPRFIQSFNDSRGGS